MFDNNGATEKDTMKNVSHAVRGLIGNKALAEEEAQRIAAQKKGQTLKVVNLMEKVCSTENMWRACKRVVENKGAPGADGMKAAEITAWLVESEVQLADQLKSGTYLPQPVKRVEIPKPNGGKRLLGIPNVKDRLVQQAVLQILNEVFDSQFSESSYGFRQNKSAHQALEQAAEYVKEGRVTVVDLDIEKFFDNVNHDILMSRICRRIDDKPLLKLIRKFLQSGVMINGICMSNEKGTPQGGPLSPLLANIMLDDLDKELERRGHKFCRYADDCNIYVFTQSAGERVKKSVTEFLNRVLRLKVNEEKSTVAPSCRTKVPGVPNKLECLSPDSTCEHCQT
jgi:group II intron reverse transcriptase/maturase